jgi:hypothetical protein
MSDARNTARTRQDKPTVRIPVRTLHECAARAAAYYACLDLGLPAPDLNR